MSVERRLGSELVEGDKILVSGEAAEVGLEWGAFGTNPMRSAYSLEHGSLKEYTIDPDEFYDIVDEVAA